MTKQKKAVIIGAGHNGLVAGCMMAKNGYHTTILEKRSVLGGCASTEELWNGFKVSPAAYVISLFLPEIIKELKLNQYGLKILPRSPSSFTPDMDGPGLVLGPDKARNYSEISQYSQHDAEQYEKYEAMLTKVAEAVEPILTSIPPRLSKKGMGKLLEYKKAYDTATNLAGLQEIVPEAAELFLGAATPILHRYFRTELLKATLATDAIIGFFGSPRSQGSAYVLLHHVMGSAGGARGVWGHVRGGMGGLATALEQAATDLGVEIRREAPVNRIDVDRNGVKGVLADKFYPADIVLSSVSAALTSTWLDFPAEYLDSIKRIDYSSASAKINLALKELPKFICEKPGCLNGTVHISPTLNYIEEAYHDAAVGRVSKEPILEITTPTVLDDSLAPKGRHIISIFVQYCPYDGNRDVLYGNSMRVLERYCPHIEDLVLHKQVLTPKDLEQTYGLTGGNIFQGSMGLHQLGPLRLDYETPVKGLYFCGAAASNGGGVLGACGRNAAMVAMGK